MTGRHNQRRRPIERDQPEPSANSADEGADLWGPLAWPGGSPGTEGLPILAALGDEQPDLDVALRALASAQDGQPRAAAFPAVAPVRPSFLTGPGAEAEPLTDRRRRWASVRHSGLIAAGMVAVGIVAGIVLARTGTLTAGADRQQIAPATRAVSPLGDTPAPPASPIPATPSPPGGPGPGTGADPTTPADTDPSAPTGGGSAAPTGADRTVPRRSSPEATGTSAPRHAVYNLMITRVPDGVGAIYLRVNQRPPTCLAVRPGEDTNGKIRVHAGDTVVAIWHADLPCVPRTSLEHISLAQVEPGSPLTNFWFELVSRRAI